MRNLFTDRGGGLIIVFMLAFSLAACNHRFPENSVSPKIAFHIDSMADRCWELREVNTDSSLQIGLETLELAKEYNYIQAINRLNNYIGVLYSHYQYEYRKAIPYFHRSMEQSIVDEDTKQLAYAYNNLSYVYLEVGNIALAMKYAQNALTEFKKTNNPAGLAYAYTSIASVYRIQKAHRKALKYFKLAHELRIQVSPHARQGSALYNVARTYEVAGILDSALIYYNKAIEKKDISRISRYGSGCLSGIANIQVSQGEYDMAIKNYETALEWDAIRDHQHGIINSYIGLAHAYAHRNQYQQGLAYLDSALEMSKIPRLQPQTIKIHKAYIHFYEILGEFEKANQIFDQFLREYDSILSMQQIEIVNELEKNFDINRDLAEKDKKLEIDNILFTHMIVAIILMVVIIIFLIRLYRNHRKMIKQLHESNQTKDKLFSVISHDLRNPFNALVGFSDLLIESLNEKDYAQAEEYAQVIQKSSNEGNELATKLLNWAMTQKGKIEFSPEAMEINNTFEHLKQHFHTHTEKYAVLLSFENNVGSKIFADHNIINIILINLINNAFKYTPENGSIKVTAQLSEKNVIFKVTDSGIGMPREMVDRIAKHHKFNESKQGLRNEKGSGLGLNIVQELLETHKGKMHIISEPGKGTTFEVKFPIQTD